MKCLILFIFPLLLIIQADEECRRNNCPQDCGQTVDEQGCKKCDCSVNPFHKPTPKPPMKLVPPTMPSSDDETTQNPQLSKRAAEDDMLPQNDAVLCRKTCQPDCGCTVENGNAKCHCSTFNHPLMRTTPPRPPCHLALPTCQPQCKLEFVTGKICPICKCPEKKVDSKK